MTDRLGPVGGTLIAAAILCSVFGALNGNILAKPRVAYALARYRFRGREALFTVFVAGLLFPATVAAIPPAVACAPCSDTPATPPTMGR